MEYFSLEDRNYYSDARVRAKDEIWWESILGKTVILKERTENGKRQSTQFEYEVCSLCEGKGTHVNPSIDANGLTAEDFYEDPEFFEDYRSGVYNVPCYLCSGIRVIPKAIGAITELDDEEDYED